MSAHDGLETISQVFQSVNGRRVRDVCAENYEKLAARFLNRSWGQQRELLSSRTSRRWKALALTGYTIPIQDG